MDRTPTIRQATVADRDALYDICLRTGDHGEDGTGLYRDPRLLGEVYVGPYLALSPDLAFVLADDADRPTGYVLGVADTRAFADACERHWWPPLQARHPIGSAEAGTPDAAVVRLIHAPPPVPAEVLAEHPAHLHVDLLPSVQGRGHGRRLLTTLFDALRAQEVRGVHLGVSARNPRAVAFYRHLGFRTLQSDDDGAVLGLRLT